MISTIVENQIKARCLKKFVERCWTSFLEKRERLKRQLKIHLKCRRIPVSRRRAKEIIAELKALNWEKYRDERVSKLGF